MNAPEAASEPHREIEAVLNRYAEACDRKQFDLLAEVFAPDGAADYGPGYRLVGPDAIAASVASMLGGCGPTQHLLGNVEIHVDGDRATATCKIRAFHVGVGAHATDTYEVFGHYHDDLVVTPDGWRIALRRMEVTLERGTRDVLAPAPT